MRIVYLSASIIPGPEANSVQVARMCDNFATDHEVILVCRTGESISEERLKARYGLKSRFRVVRCWWPAVPVLGSLIYALQVLVFALCSKRPDVFYGRHLISLWLVRFLGVPVIYEAHMPAGSRMARLLCRQLFRHSCFRRLVCVSEKLLSHYRRNFPSIVEENSLVAPNGADRFEPVTSGQQFQLPDSVVGYIGSAKKEKGIDLVLGLAAKMPSQAFCVAGPSHEALLSLGYEVPDNVYLPGFLSQDEIAAILPKLTVVLAPYKPGEADAASALTDDAQWGSPLKIFEFMSAGKCIIASDIDIVRELIDSGVEGVLCPAGDIEAWAEALVALLGNKTERQRLSDNARHRFAEKYDRAVRARYVLEGN